MSSCSQTRNSVQRSYRILFQSG